MRSTIDLGTVRPRPAVVFIFAKSRSGREIRSQLAGYSGIVQVDAYSAYTALAKPGRNGGPITLAYCMAHARRKYTDLYKKAPSALCRDVIERFAQIYAIEEEIRGMIALARREIRQAKTAPLMSALKLALESGLEPISKKSAMAGGHPLLAKALDRADGLLGGWPDRDRLQHGGADDEGHWSWAPKLVVRGQLRRRGELGDPGVAASDRQAQWARSLHVAE